MGQEVFSEVGLPHKGARTLGGAKTGLGRKKNPFSRYSTDLNMIYKQTTYLGYGKFMMRRKNV